MWINYKMTRAKKFNIIFFLFLVPSCKLQLPPVDDEAVYCFNIPLSLFQSVREIKPHVFVFNAFVFDLIVSGFH